MRLSLKLFLFVLLSFSVLIAGIVLPENGRTRALKIGERFGSHSVSYAEQKDDFLGMRSLIYGEQGGAVISWFELPFCVSVNDHVKKTGLTDPQGSELIDQLMRTPYWKRGIEVLRLQTRHPVSSKAIRHLAGMNNLRHLAISCGRFDDQATKAISTLDNLETLILVDCQFDVDDFESWSRLEYLAWVSITEKEPGITAGISRDGLKSMRENTPSAFVQRKYGFAYKRKKIKEFYAAIKKQSALLKAKQSPK